jgi:hypothetical protein
MSKVGELIKEALMEAIQETLTEAAETVSLKRTDDGEYDVHHTVLGKIGSLTHKDGHIKGTIHGVDFSIKNVENKDRLRKLRQYLGKARWYGQKGGKALDRHNGVTVRGDSNQITSGTAEFPATGIPGH